MSGRASLSTLSTLVAVAIVAVAAPSRAGIYGVGITGEYGNAYLPPTGEVMVSTTLHYEEHGGFLGNLLFLVASAPVEPEGETTVSQEHRCLGEGRQKTCNDVVVTRTTTPSQADLEEYERQLAAWDPAIAQSIMRGEAGQELDIDVPLRALGGKTSGFMIHMWYPVGWNGRVSIAAVALGWMTFHDVKTHVVHADPTEIRATEKVASFTYKYAGIPVRVQTAIGRSGLGAHLQLDLNLLSIAMDQPSPIRAGLSWAGYHVIATVEGVVTGLRPDGASLNAQVQLGF